MSNDGVLERLQERSTGMQRPEEFMRHPGVFDLRDRETGDIRPHTLDSNEEFELSLTVGVRYWANKVQRSQAREHAEILLARLLYRDVLAGLDEIRHAIWDGDKSAALTRLSALEQRITR